MQSDGFKLQLFFSPLQTKVVTTRKHFLEELEREFDTEEDIYNRNGIGRVENGSLGEDKSKYYPVLLRLSYECPFDDVRLTCGRILTKLEDQGVRIPKRKHVGPSRFISNNDCVLIHSDDPVIHEQFVDVFLANGRTSHIVQLLGYHTQYLSCFRRFETYLMSCDGPLSLHWRFYIGIMGASRHHCAILIEECEEMFLFHHGDPSWLQGSDHIPKKLQNLNSLNRLLAHQPWLTDETVLKTLLDGPTTVDNWSVSELIQAIVILAHYQALSGFIFGCGITPEIDRRKGHTCRNPSTGDSSSGTEALTPTKLKTSSFERSGGGTTAVLFKKIKDAQLEESFSQDQDEKEQEKFRQFKEIERKDLDDDVYKEKNGVSQSHYSKYYDNIGYKEFAKREKNIEIFRAHDYSWQEHAFSFINRLYPEIGNLLDEKFNCAYDLTYRTMGDNITNVDTSKFRLATWNYIHVLYGIFHDDYLYYEVNKLLEKSYKTYIKKVACFPEQITFLDYWEYYADMLPSEKVHINLLVLESRMQAIMLYASRLLMTYMK